jgi:hypothetical protein
MTKHIPRSPLDNCNNNNNDDDDVLFEADFDNVTCEDYSYDQQQPKIITSH